MRLTALVSFVVVASACDGIVSGDCTSADCFDSGVVMPSDAGGEASDAGLDASVALDAGQQATDAGLAIDAGTLPFGDAGVTVDAGLVVDAGAPVDGGVMPFDAGVPPIDAGVPEPVDAGDPALAGHVFIASPSARPNDVLSLQGEGFGASPHVWLERAGTRIELPILNRVGTTWLAAQMPASLSGLGVSVRVDNGLGLSAFVPLNAAAPYHLDAVSISPNGAFRIFGRNLFMPGAQPTVLVQGKPALCSPLTSEERMLTCTAPSELTTTAAVEITVDNGLGYGPTRLERRVAVSTTGAGDPFAIGVGWAAAFSTLTGRVLTATLVADGLTDDRDAIQAALTSASTLGGGIVQLPASNTILIKGTLELPNNVVLRGAGKDSTKITYQNQWPILTNGRDLIGVSDLTFTSNNSTQSLAINSSTRVFLKNVRIENGASLHASFAQNRDMVVRDCDFIQTGKRQGNGPFYFGFTSGLTFVNNTVQFVIGAPDFHGVHDAYIANNHISRDSSNQNIVDQSDGVVHSMAINFVSRTAIIGNTFDTLNGRVTNLARNDGETIISEGGGANRTKNLGTVQAATANTLTDATNSFDFDPFGLGETPENFGVWITAGLGAGQMRTATAYDPTTKTFTLEAPWAVIPDGTSRYVTFVPGLEKTLIQGNQLAGNSRGIWLYQTSAREIDIVGNAFDNTGGIYLRAWQDAAAKQFCPQYDVNIENNVISNLASTNSSYATALLVQKDTSDVGMAFVNLRYSGNTVTASTPNFTSSVSDYSSVVECYRVASVFEGIAATPVARIIGTVLQRNRANNCEVAFRTGTGSSGVVLTGTTVMNVPTVWANEPANGSATGATEVVVIP